MSRLERFAGSALVSDRRMQFMVEPAITFGDITLSRRKLTEYEVISGTASMTRLIGVLNRYGIDTPYRLFMVGLGSLAKCEGVGEATLWAASVLVEAGGHDVQTWIGRSNEGFESRITQAAKRARGRRKDPAPTVGRRSRDRRRKASA